MATIEDLERARIAHETLKKTYKHLDEWRASPSGRKWDDWEYDILRKRNKALDNIPWKERFGILEEPRDGGGLLPGGAHGGHTGGGWRAKPKDEIGFFQHQSYHVLPALFIMFISLLLLFSMFCILNGMKITLQQFFINRQIRIRHEQRAIEENRQQQCDELNRENANPTLLMPLPQREHSMLSISINATY